MITHRQKQFGIIAFAIIFLIILEYNIHQNVRARLIAEKPVQDDHSNDPLEQLLAFSTTTRTTSSESSTATDFYDHLKAIVASLVEAGVIDIPATSTETASAPDQTLVGHTVAPVETSTSNYLPDFLNFVQTTSTELFLPTELPLPTDLSLPTEVMSIQWEDSDWQGNDQMPTAVLWDETPTQSASYAIISQLSFETVEPEPQDYQYSRALVIARTTKEDISWIDEAFGDDPLLEKAIYTVDNPVEPYILPANKGHEVMAYLTFIIDFYDDLPNISIFMHAHATAWHNNELLEMSSAEMLKHMNFRKVIRDGYVNLRCHRYPSCPDHLFPIAKNNSEASIPEEAVFADAWREILPFEDVPEVVSQPCCGQFAISRERIQLLPRAQYEHFRRWLMYTTLEDRVSGRVWEYIYQYIWLGVPQLCPKEHVCYCDLYGVCFGGEAYYEDYYAKKSHVDVLERLSNAQVEAGGNKTWPVDYVELVSVAQEAVKADLRNAFLRGSDPYNRAVEVERPFKAGDGF